MKKNFANAWKKLAKKWYTLADKTAWELDGAETMLHHTREKCRKYELELKELRKFKEDNVNDRPLAAEALNVWEVIAPELRKDESMYECTWRLLEELNAARKVVETVHWQLSRITSTCGVNEQLAVKEAHDEYYHLLMEPPIQEEFKVTEAVDRAKKILFKINETTKTLKNSSNKDKEEGYDK